MDILLDLANSLQREVFPANEKSRPSFPERLTIRLSTLLSPRSELFRFPSKTDDLR